MKDHGDRRQVADRRRYHANYHFPERRAIRFRRSGDDRREGSMTVPFNALERRRAFFKATPKAA